MFDAYSESIEPYWISLPLNLRNAVSMIEPQWTCWEPGKTEQWVRTPPGIAITALDHFRFYRYAMEFEEFVPRFGEWYGKGAMTACFVGIRANESLNRWRTIAGHGIKFRGLKWTNRAGRKLYNFYPVYDWHVEDIWTFHGKTKIPYNRTYDLMYKAGLSVHQMRICQPYGDDQRKGLWLWHVLEPDTWHRVVTRVSGANSGALYARESGNILGNRKISLPQGHTWESYAKLLLTSMPPKARERYETKIAVFLNWYSMRGYPDGIPDEADPKMEAGKKAPSWRRVCRAMLKNDYWCKSLSFSQHASGKYTAYARRMAALREQLAQWGKTTV
jgi:predicted phosphoadenosine phosphosulfate sulfurtransferase